jgi:ribose/xylose/arabinose/galactoside ABC-type transport system permease subunit
VTFHFGRELTILATLFLLTAVVSFVNPAFLDRQNIEDILVNSSYVAVAAVGMTLIILTANIDISFGSILAVCSIVAGLLAKSNVPIILVVAITVALGALLGGINGALTAKLKIPSIIATIGTMTILRGMILWLTKGYWVQDLPPDFRLLGTGRMFGIPIPVCAMFVVFGFFIIFLRYTQIGREIYAVGSNREAARLSGINVSRIVLLVFTLAGALIGLATMIYATRFTVIQSNAGIGFEFVVITAVVVGGTNIFGGRGTIVGTVLGVFLLGVTSTALTFLKVSPYWEQSVQGALILAAVVTDTMRHRAFIAHKLLTW